MNEAVVGNRVVGDLLGLVGFVLMSLCLTACSQFLSNGDELYLRSKNGRPVVVQPPLTDTNISHFYELPSVKANSSPVSVLPPFVPSKKS